MILAARSASAIRLEEYFSGPAASVLTERTLSTEEFHEIANAFPMTIQYGVPGPLFVKRCFRPHHRIVIVNKDTQRETILNVCFGCEQLRIGNHSIEPTPTVWQQPIRQLFLRHDIPIRDDYNSQELFEQAIRQEAAPPG